MAIGDPYIGTADLAKRVGQPDDGTYDGHIRAASQMIELSTGRQFNKQTTATARRFRAADPCILPVDDFHTTTGLLVDVDGVPVDPSEFELNPPDGVYRGQPGWPFFQILKIIGFWSWKARRQIGRAHV